MSVKTIHYINGCPWADGHIHVYFDTAQTKDWSKVTCRHCLANRGKCPKCGHYVERDRRK